MFIVLCILVFGGNCHNPGIFMIKDFVIHVWNVSLCDFACLKVKADFLLQVIAIVWVIKSCGVIWCYWYVVQCGIEVRMFGLVFFFSPKYL